MKRVDSIVNIHTEEVEDILGRAPAWLVRWGSLSIFMGLALIFSAAAFLRYPKTMAGNLRLTTSQQPVKVVSKVPGKLEKIYADKVFVRQGQKLALIENPLSADRVDMLEETVRQVDSFLDGKTHKVKFYDVEFGYIQSDYNILRKKVVEFQFFRGNEYYTAKVKRLKQQIKHNENLVAIAREELTLNGVALKNSEEKFRVDKKLFDSNVTAKVDFLAAENDFVKQQQQGHELKRRIEELELTSLEYKRLLEDLMFELKQKELDFTESINQSLKLIETAITNWQQNFLIQAPVSGKAFLLNSITEKQHVNTNEPVFMVVPATKKYVCFVDVASKGFGKIMIGQRVRIKLNNYPSYEFGQLTGHVIQVPEIPIESGSGLKGATYRVTVEIDQSVRTTYNRLLDFNAEMSGVGEIVTEERTLLQRLFEQIRGRMDN